MSDLSGQQSNDYRKVWLFVLVVALLQGLYAIGFIGRTSFVVEGQRYFCLTDDAMVAMRYGSNWANGDGLCWNPGERVEGYTTFLWTIIMGLCHFLPLSPSHTCLLIQILGVLVLWLCLVATVMLARAANLPTHLACCAVLLAATYYELIFFTLMGMETGLQAALITFALADSVVCLNKGKANARPMLWFTIAFLVRPDVALVVLFTFVFLLFSVSKGRLSLTIGFLVLVLVAVTHLLWRYSYYGQWLPNTYYLKVTDWPLVNRLKYSLTEALFTGLILGWPILFSLAGLVRPRRWHFLLLGCFALSLAYQTYVGCGDWPLNRFVAPATLSLFVLTAYGIAQLPSLSVERLGPVRHKVVCIRLAALCVIAINCIHAREFLLIARPTGVRDCWTNVQYVHAIEQIVDPKASVAVTMAGVFPYFSGRRCVDLLGKCDLYIARTPVHLEVRRAGHNKFDVEYSLKTYKPDIVLPTLIIDSRGPIFKEHYRPVSRVIDGYEMPFLVRKDTSGIEGAKSISWDDYSRCLQLSNQRRVDFQALKIH